MFTSPGAIAISILNLDIYWYGIILAVAFIVGQLVAFGIAKKEYPKDTSIAEHLYELAFWTLICGILGARLYYVILSLDFYSSHIAEIFMLNHGGLSIHGGIIGGLLGGGFYCKSHHLNFLKYADLYALGLPIAQAIGRWGNFFNSEAFGLPTTLPWGIYIPPNSRPLLYEFNEFFHPTFLYEFLWNILIFLILYFIVKKFFFKKHGVLFCSYLILYSIGRILIEFIRIDAVLEIFGISVAIWVCFLTILIALFFLIYIYKKSINSKM